LRPGINYYYSLVEAVNKKNIDLSQSNLTGDERVFLLIIVS